MEASGFQSKRSAYGLKYAVLGLVVEQRAYAYLLVKRLEELIGDAYRLQPSAVYTALNQLESAGFIRETERQAAGSTKRSPRVMYAATQAGEHALAAWLDTPLGAAEPVRSELVRRLALAQEQHATGLLESIESAQLDCLDVIEAAATRAENAASVGPQTRWSTEIEDLVHQYGVRLMNAQLEWLRDASAVIARLRDEGASPEGS